GNSSSGEFAHTLNVTDIHTTWTESGAVLGRSEGAVQRALNEIAGVLPFRLLGVDSDNGSEFINWHLKSWCEQNQIQLTRGRPYKKDDNAHIEQKNWTHVRKLLGWERYDTHQAIEAKRSISTRVAVVAEPVSSFGKVAEESAGGFESAAGV
ncbi:MAG: transposase family protein, partial [Candidatus Acidiferrales bacterium]